MNKNIKDKIQAIPIWNDDISIKNLDGGMTNQNFLIQENNFKFVVRLGDDIPEHLVSRSNELIVSKAAAKTGIGPKVIYQSKGILVLDYIESITLSDEGVRKNIKSIIPIIKKIHNEIPKNLYGQSLIFWVFHVIRNYVNFLKNNQSRHLSILSDLISKSELLEIKSTPYDIVFCHNDLLPANFLDDGSRIWVIDWEYAGYNTPLFDLGGLSSNNNFSLEEEIYLLENYFEKKINDKLIFQYNCLKAASLLRETMWSMVSEITSKIDADYASYTQENLIKFNKAYEELDL